MRVRWDETDPAAWDAAHAAATGALQQDRAYGDAMLAMQVPVLRAVVERDGESVALAQFIVRRFGQLGAVALCSRGPLWLCPLSAADKAQAYRALRRTLPLSGLRFMLVTPEEAAGEPNGLSPLRRVMTGMSTVMLDLTQPPDALRAGLEHRWRNRLAGGERAGDARAKEIAHLGEQVVVMRRLLHALRLPLHVHDTERAIAVADRRQAVRIAKAFDVIDHVRAGRQRLAHHERPAGVDRQWLAAIAQRIDHRHHAIEFFFGRDRRRAGSGRFAADIDDVDAVGDHLLRMRQRQLERIEAATIGEGIGRDVQDAHHQRTEFIAGDGQPVAAALQGGFWKVWHSGNGTTQANGVGIAPHPVSAMARQKRITQMVCCTCVRPVLRRVRPRRRWNLRSGATSASLSEDAARAPP